MFPDSGKVSEYNQQGCIQLQETRQGLLKQEDYWSKFDAKFDPAILTRFNISSTEFIGKYAAERAALELMGKTSLLINQLTKKDYAIVQGALNDIAVEIASLETAMNTKCNTQYKVCIGMFRCNHEEEIGN